MELELIEGAFQNIWPMLTIFLVVITSIRVTYLHVNNEKFVFYKEFLNLVFVVYALLLFDLLTNAELNTSSGLNLVPFTEILRYKVGTHGFYLNVIGNILLLISVILEVIGFIMINKVVDIKY